MNLQIFCPSDHFMLNQPVCPQCGWAPPPPLPQGSLLWQPVGFSCGIGGPSLDSYVRPGILDGVAVYPLRSGEMVGISQADGGIAWRTEPSPELYPRALLPDGGYLLAVLPDNRPLDRSGNGFLARVLPKSGQVEKLWESYGFTMTEPVFTDSRIIVRTARPKLVALNRKDPSRVDWEVPLRTYKTIPPAVSPELVVVWDGEIIKEQMVLKAYNLENGKFVWQTNISDIDCSPQVVGRYFIYRTRKKILTCLDLANGNQVWQKTYKKLYCPPAEGGGRIYLVFCASDDVKSLERYTLQCLDPASGETIWQNPVGIRSEEIIYRGDQTLLLGMGVPELSICSAQDGSVIWQHAFGKEKIDRIQTRLVVEDGVCWVGTYKGDIAAIQISKQEGKKPNLKEIDEAAYPDKAAEAYLLNGKLRQAAEIYLEKLGQPNKALAIFKHLNDLSGQADVHVSLGDELTAAKLYEKDGRLLEAAQNYEKANEPRLALRLYSQLNLMDDVVRLRAIVPFEYSDIEALEKNGKFAEAGEAALKIQEFEKAYLMYQQAGEKFKEQAYSALKLICESDPEAWSLEKLAETARGRGEFLTQAQALEKLEQYDKAAEAYQFAARQLEERSPRAVQEISALYDHACRFFRQEGLEKKRETCWRKIIFYRSLPWIRIDGHSENAFREGEFNAIKLIVTNDGFGRASQIKLQVLGDRFEVDQYNLPEVINALAAGGDREIVLPIRPKENQVGEVPLTISWEWTDRHGTPYSDRNTVTVNVKQQQDRRTGGTPVIINAEKYFAGDDMHQVIHGDKLESGAKKDSGDRVEIHRDGRVRVIDSEYGELAPSNLAPKCPNCSVPNEKDARFCVACGAELTRKKSK